MSIIDRIFNELFYNHQEKITQNKVEGIMHRTSEDGL
jgi:hypothetical protein